MSGEMRCPTCGEIPTSRHYPDEGDRFYCAPCDHEWWTGVACSHESYTGDEGPVANLPGGWPVRWRCDGCGALKYDDEALAALRQQLAAGSWWDHAVTLLRTALTEPSSSASPASSAPTPGDEA